MADEWVNDRMNTEPWEEEHAREIGAQMPHGPEVPRRMVTPLRVARVAAGLRQAELAEIAGVTRQTIGTLEGGGQPRLGTAQALAAALAVPIAELFPSKAPAASLDAEARRDGLEQRERDLIAAGSALAAAFVVEDQGRDPVPELAAWHLVAKMEAA